MCVICPLYALLGQDDLDYKTPDFLKMLEATYIPYVRLAVISSINPLIKQSRSRGKISLPCSISCSMM
jgi:hypothetical protein